jgi:hypothetical protein
MAVAAVLEVKWISRLKVTLSINPYISSSIPLATLNKPYKLIIRKHNNVSFSLTLNKVINLRRTYIYFDCSYLSVFIVFIIVAEKCTPPIFADVKDFPFTPAFGFNL